MQYQNISDKKLDQYIQATVFALLMLCEYACVFMCIEPFLARGARAIFCDHYIFPLATFAGLFSGWGYDMVAINAGSTEVKDNLSTPIMMGAMAGASVGILFMQVRATCGARSDPRYEEPMIELGLPDTEAQAPSISSNNSAPVPRAMP